MFEKRPLDSCSSIFCRISLHEQLPRLGTITGSSLRAVSQRVLLASWNVFEIVQGRAHVPKMKHLRCGFIAIAASHVVTPEDSIASSLERDVRSRLDRAWREQDCTNCGCFVADLGIDQDRQRQAERLQLDTRWRSQQHPWSDSSHSVESIRAADSLSENPRHTFSCGRCFSHASLVRNVSHGKRNLPQNRFKECRARTVEQKSLPVPQPCGFQGCGF